MRVLTEKEAEEFLEKQGFLVVQRAFAKQAGELEKISKKIPLPWAMKISSKSVVHKKREGGVFVNINSIEQAKEAMQKLSLIQGYETTLIQPMISGEELILGIKKTPEFSHALMIGKGGSAVEKEKDVSFRVIPLDKTEIKNMVAELRCYENIKEKVSLSKVEQTLVKLTGLAKKFPKIQELDINPLIVNEQTATVVDARIVFDD
jgi:succinyl-CoA synthetase beta subunit